MGRDAQRQSLRAFAIATVAGVLLSVAYQDATLGGDVPVALCNATAPTCNGTCPVGESCETISRGDVTECVCQALGCCLVANHTACQDARTALNCFAAGGTWTEGGTCGVDCLIATATATPTSTGTATATPTGIPDGGSCADPVDCTSGNCVDDVCCDTICDGPRESCNQPGREGVCSAIAAAAPAASPIGLLALVALLGGVAGLALWRRRLV